MLGIRNLAFALAGLALLLPTTTANATVLSAAADPDPSSVGMRIAIAETTLGTTRWSDVSVPEGSALGWLVPVRPGAVIDWAPGPWLDALDGATAPRIVAPTSTPACAIRRSAEVVGWTTAHAPQAAAPFAIAATAENAKEWAKTRGFLVSVAHASRIDELYASGWKVAAVEVAASDSARTSASLRVIDDGGPVLPLALTGQTKYRTELTVFVLGAGVASIAKPDVHVTTQDIDRSKVLWGLPGSNYAAYRENLMTSGTVWLRESASHDALFLNDLSAGSPAINSVVKRYFDDPDCAARVRDLGVKEEATTAAELTCGERTDLALAIAGTAPSEAFVTRLVGVQRAGSLGENLSIEVSPNAVRPVAVRAGFYVICQPGSSPPSYDPPETSGDPYDPPRSTSSGLVPPSKGSQTGGGGGGGYSGSDTDLGIYVPSDGCGGGGGGTVVTDDSDDDDDDDDTTTDGWDTSDSSDSCSSDTSDTSSDSSSDSCSSDTGGSTDGWDSSDSNDCSVVHARKRRRPSPFSRLAIFAVALLLPLRRRWRPLSGDQS